MIGGVEPTAETLARILLARTRARVALAHADENYRDLLWSVFRAELGTCVTRVSPFLVALLDREGLIVDDLAWSIAPGRGWPFQPLAGGLWTPRERLRRAKYRGAGGPAARPVRPDLAGVVIGVRDGGRVRIQVVEDAIEVTGRIGSVLATSARGMVRLTAPGFLPRSVASAAIGQPASAVVDLPVLAGRDWQVVAVESSSRGSSTFVVETGCRPYTLPWAMPP